MPASRASSRAGTKAAAIAVLVMAVAVLLAATPAAAARPLLLRGRPARTLLQSTMGSTHGTTYGGRYAPGAVMRPTYMPYIYDENNGYYPEVADQPRDYDTSLWGLNGRR